MPELSLKAEPTDERRGMFAALIATLIGTPPKRPQSWDRQERSGLAPAHSDPEVRRRAAPIELHVVATSRANAAHNATAAGHAKRCTNLKKLRRRVRLGAASPEKRAEMTSRVRRRKALAAK